MDHRGPRGEMRAIPADSPRRLVALNAINKLISGATVTRTALFGADPKDKFAQYWQPRLIRRMLREGAIVCSTTYNHRMYLAGDLERLAHFRKLLQEEDPALQVRGYRGIFEIDKKLRGILDGILLGDGHYTKLNSPLDGSSFQIEQRRDRIEWLKWIGCQLSAYKVDFSITDSVGKKSPPNKIGHCYMFSDTSKIRTKRYWTFSVERSRWYPEGLKRVPRDLDISSPQLLAQWHMGDGSTSKNIGKIVLCTDGFPMEDVLWLKGQLHERLAIECSVGNYSGKPRIAISVANAEKFIELMRPHILKVFSYKIESLWKRKLCLKCQVPILNRSRCAELCDACSYGSERRRRLDLVSG